MHPYTQQLQAHLQEQRQPARKQRSGAGGCPLGNPAAGSALLSLQSYSSTTTALSADTTRRAPAGQHVATLTLGEAVGYHY